MWQLLFRKMRADVRSRPFQFALTALLLASSAAGITLGLTVRDAADRPWERAFEAGNGPHMWMSSPDTEAMERVFGLSDVAETGPVMRSVGEFSSLGTEQKPDVYALEAPADEGQFVGKPLMTAGRWLDPAAATPQVVIGAGAARELGLEPGDAWTVGGHGREVTYEVVGVGVLTFRAPYPTWSPVFAYVNTAGFEALVAPGADLAYRAGVRLHDPYGSQDVFRKLAATRNGGEPLELSVITWEGVLEGVNEDFLFHQITFFIFGTLTALASVLVVANAIAGQVIAQSREIGALKTVGMTPGGVLRLFVLENAAVAVVAGVVGAAAGIALGQLVVLQNSSLFGGAVVGVPWVSVAVSVAVTVVIAAAATVIPAWRAGRMPVAGAAPGGSGRGWRLPGALMALRRLPAYSAGTRLVWSSRSRAVLTVTAIALAVVSSTLLLGFNTLLFDEETHRLLGAPPADAIVQQVGDVGPGGLDPVVNDPRVESYYTYMEFTARAGEGALAPSVNMRGFGGEFTLADWQFVAGGPPEGPGEVAAGWRVAERLGLVAGDTVTLSRDGKFAEVSVAGIISNDDNGGNAVWISLEDVRAAYGSEAFPTHAAVTLREGVDEGAFADGIRNSDAGHYDVELMSEAVGREIGQFAPAVYTLSTVMLVIAALSVLSSTMLTVRERFRDIASLKAAGMTPAQVVYGVLAAVAGLAVAGLAVGVPLGLLVNRQVMGFIGEEADTAVRLVADPALVWVLLMCVLIAAVVIAAALVPARIGGTVSVTEALRYE